MLTPALHSVGLYRATVLAKLLYYNQAWSGFCSAAVRDRIDSFVSCSKHSGYCADSVPPVTELFADSDTSLFERVLSNANNTLHEMQPPLNNIYNYNLRKRPHHHQLPVKGNSLQQSNIVIRLKTHLFCDLFHICASILTHLLTYLLTTCSMWKYSIHAITLNRTVPVE